MGCTKVSYHNSLNHNLSHVLIDRAQCITSLFNSLVKIKADAETEIETEIGYTFLCYGEC